MVYNPYIPSPTPEMGRLEYIVPGTTVRATDVMISCLNAGIGRKLRISRPRQMSMDQRLVGTLLLHFDESRLCPPGSQAEVPDSKHRTSKCKRWYHLIEVPLRSSVSETEALALANLVIQEVFLSLQIQTARARSAPRRERQRPLRVYAPARTAGSIGNA